MQNLCETYAKHTAQFGVFASCPAFKIPLNDSAETWPSGRRRSPAKGVYVNAYRGFESLRLCHHPYIAIITSKIRGLVVVSLGAYSHA